MKKITFYFTFLMLITQSTFAVEPAFEAYSKFILGGQHAGYTLQRFEIDNKSNTMTSTYYTFVKTPTGSTTESLVAKSDLNFEPLSYQYTALVDGVAKSVDANFKMKKMSANMTSNKNKLPVTLTVPANGFLSTFLNFVLVKNGLMVGKNYSFFALAEESPACMTNEADCDRKLTGFLKGSVNIKSTEKFKGIDAFKIEINFKGIKLEGYISEKGDILGSNSPLQNASTAIVASKNEAVGHFPFNEKHIKALFGSIPLGKKNALYETSSPTQISTQNVNSTEMTTKTTPGSNQGQDKKVDKRDDKRLDQKIDKKKILDQ